MNNNEYEMPNKRGLLKPTLQITFFSILGILVSFATQIIIAAKFGATMERDAYFAAIVIPAYITTVLLGSLTITFVPIFIEHETKKSKAEAWKIASIFTNLTILVLFGISLLGFIFAKQLISVTAPGFKGVQLSLTASLLRIIFPAIIFSGLSSLLSSIYYAEHRFLRPAILPVITAILMLLSVVFFSRCWGIKSLAFGYLIGGVVGFLILVPVFFKQGQYNFSLDFSNEGVRQVIRVMAPLVLAGLFYRATIVIERMIASTLPTGSISYLGYATRITQILGSVATAGIATTIFPVMARSWAENDLAKVRENFAKGVRIIMLTTFPIAMIFAVLRVPIIQIAFERGAFDHTTTIAVANVLAILLVVFITSGLGNVTAKGFYISQRTKLRALMGVGLVVVYWWLAYVFSKHFSYMGLAMAQATHRFIEFVVIIAIMRWIYKGLNSKHILIGFFKIAIASTVSGVCVYCSFKLLPIDQQLVLRTAISGVLGFLIYLMMVFWVFRIEEAVLMKEKLFTKTVGVAAHVRN